MLSGTHLRSTGVIVHKLRLSDMQFLCCWQEASQAQQHKAFLLWQWGRAAGEPCSRDEVLEMVVSDKLPQKLTDLWVVRSAQQKAVAALSDAVRSGDVTAVKVCINA